MMGIKPHAAALGLRYGRPLYFDQRDPLMDADQAEIIKTTSIIDLDYGKGIYRSARTSAALLPALFTWTDSTPAGYDWLVPDEGSDYRDRQWLWSPETFRSNRFAQIHAFDIEIGLGLFVYVESGFSLGETLDFLLGFLFIDIAGDDGRWKG